MRQAGTKLLKSGRLRRGVYLLPNLITAMNMNSSQLGSCRGDRFVGLPLRAGAEMIAATILFCHHGGLEDRVHPFAFLAEEENQRSSPA